MPALDDFAKQFGRPQSAWTREQWKEVAIELASRLDSNVQPPAKRGRPSHDKGAFVQGKNGEVTISQKANYAALAWQVQQRMQNAEANGRPLTMKEAVLEELHHAIRRHNATPAEQRGQRSGELRESRANEMLETAYTEVRKLLRKTLKKSEA